MAVSEFGLIHRYFNRSLNNTKVNRLGVGDDCALMSIPDGYELAITTDTMVEGVHFFENANPEQLGYKLLAVNLSDLAAMGAEPVAVSLALTMPKVDERWLEQFAAGFWQVAEQFSVDLIGGDTTSGHLTLTVQAFGLVAKNRAIKRSTAQVGDLIYVTGLLGEAGLGLKIEQGVQCQNAESVLKRFHQPEPRVKQGLAIADYANACIDLSDGLASDLRHITDASGVGACIEWEKLPLSASVLDYIQQTKDWSFPLVSGEDYELCFTISPDKVSQISIDCSHIGFIQKPQGLRIMRSGVIEPLVYQGYEHFTC